MWRPQTGLTLGLLAVTLWLPSAAGGQEWLRTALRGVREPFQAAHRDPLPTGKDAAVERLAAEIDWLEHHLDAYGTIVPKQPNVWGEARLTRHRDEYEQVLASRLHDFEATLNAALRRSDQSYLAMALALQAATEGNASIPGRDATTTVNNLIADPNAVIDRTKPLTSSSAFSFNTQPSNKLSLEPAVYLDQMSRYLNHLHELRRVNEGDDTADSPGYSLNLVRIPVSVLPGKKTRVGYGAEITVTAEPYLGPELLPVTFRSLAINDAVDQVALALTQYLNSVDEPGRDARLPAGSEQKADQTADSTPRAAQRAMAQSYLFRDEHDSPEGRQAVGDEMKESAANVTDVSLGRARRARLPFPPSQLLEIYGDDLTASAARQLARAFRNDLVNGDIIHYTDVESCLLTEAAAAYDWLSTPDPIGVPDAVVMDQDVNPSVWSSCTPALVQAIRQRDADTIGELREAFLNSLLENRRSDSPRYTLATAAAWGIIVHSALLNDQLIQDLREASAANGCGCTLPGSAEFFGPRPPPDVRAAFNDYVRCRWPIHVFALDPVTQDQNIGDEFARRREMQLAMALAFASGRVNAQTMSRYVRRLEWDMATIALNRTVVGFSHGNDTFGWRFYPRFQTPPIEGNLAAFGQSLFGGPSRDSDLSQRALEAGMRECTAVVLMPSFVPYCTFHSRGNWFRLTNPAQTEVSLRDTMDLSRAVTSMRDNAAQCVQCAHLYRPGDIERLLRRVEQLDRELPLQQMQVQIPYENTAGGFEIFNSGITDLAPELRGWYGAPGLHPHQATTLYLVGDGFSVHDTRLLAGGQDVPFRLVSRQILQAQFPAGLRVIPADRRNGKYFDAFVDVHLATPYGVSNYHLLVPVVRDDAAFAAADFRWNQTRIALKFQNRPAKETPDKINVEFQPFFEVRPRPVFVNVPPSTSPPDIVKIEVCVYDGEVFLGKVDVSDVKLDIRNSRYVLDEGNLTNLIGASDDQESKLRKYVRGYLNSQQDLAPQYQLRLIGRIAAEQGKLTLPVLIAGEIEVVLHHAR